MPFEEAKVYFDGSHYIAIPHTKRKVKRRRKPPEDEIVVKEEIAVTEPEDEGDFDTVFEEENDNKNEQKQRMKTIEIERTMTRKEYFEELYAEYWNLPRNERKKIIIEKMSSLFEDENDCRYYVDANFDRKWRNMSSRRIRMFRKSNLQDFNYFCTFTYDNAKHTEQSFRKGLSSCLSNFSTRKGWKYIGAWERSPENNRLHFHAIIEIPEGTMPGIICEVNDYSFATKTRQITKQNSFFNERFGRTDFEEIDDQDKMSNAIFYLLKYIEKSGEKLVYSKGLPQFFISDIMNYDVICTCGQEDKKLLLFDDFDCWDQGEYIGKVSKATIARLRKEA